MSQRAARQAARRPRLERFFGFVSRMSFAVVFVAIGALVLTLSVSPGSSPSRVAAPAHAEASTPIPTESTAATPTPTPSESTPPTPKATPALPSSLPATLAIPKAGISGASITTFDAQRDVITRNGHKELVPPSMTAVVWYNVGDNSLTSQSNGTSALYCHANTEADPGICQGLHNVVAGDELIITNPTETLTYKAMANPQAVPKTDAGENAGFQANVPLTIEMITCDRYGQGGGIDPEGHAYDNLYVFFILTRMEITAPSGVAPDPRAASRLK